MKLVWIAVLLCCLAWPAKADEFENRVRGIRKLTNANATEMAAVRSMIQVQRKFMAKAIQLEMLRDGQPTSEEKIDAMLDKWHRAYLQEVPGLAFEAHLEFYRENFSLEELKELEEILANPLVQKYTDAGLSTNRLFPQLLERVQGRSTGIMEGLIAADPNWWRLDDKETSDVAKILLGPREVDNLGPMVGAWHYQYARVLDQNDYSWSLFDIAMAESALKYGVQCNVGPSLEDVRNLLPAMKKEKQEEFEEMIADTPARVVELDTDNGSAVQTSMQVLLQAAILAGKDWSSFALSSEIAQDPLRPDCPKVRGWAYNVLRKHRNLTSLDN